MSDLNKSEAKFLQKLMSRFNVPKVQVERSGTGDISVTIGGEVPIIKVGEKWSSAPLQERQKRLLHEFLHIAGLRHDAKARAMGYYSRPERDTYSQEVYQAFVKNPEALHFTSPTGAKNIKKYGFDFQHLGAGMGSKSYLAEPAGVFVTKEKPNEAFMEEVKDAKISKQLKVHYPSGKTFYATPAKMDSKTLTYLTDYLRWWYGFSKADARKMIDTSGKGERFKKAWKELTTLQSPVLLGFRKYFAKRLSDEGYTAVENVDDITGIKQTIVLDPSKVKVVNNPSKLDSFLSEFKKGIKEELEHKDVTKGDPITTARIALAHLEEKPDYYSRLDKAMKNPEVWKIPLSKFLGKYKVYDDFGDWAEDYHLSYAQDYDPKTLKVIRPRKGNHGAYAIARIKGERKNVVLLEEDIWENSGKWYPVGAYRGMNLGISATHQGKGLGAELVLETAKIRGGKTGDTGLSPAGLAAHKAAHRLAVKRAVEEGKPVPAHVRKEYNLNPWFGSGTKVYADFDTAYNSLKSNEVVDRWIGDTWIVGKPSDIIKERSKQKRGYFASETDALRASAKSGLKAYYLGNKGEYPYFVGTPDEVRLERLRQKDVTAELKGLQKEYRHEFRLAQKKLMPGLSKRKKQVANPLGKQPWEVSQAEFTKTPYPDPPTGYINLYHVTAPEYLDSIRREGLRTDKAIGGDSPKGMVWASTKPTAYDREGALVVFRVPIDDPDLRYANEFERIITRNIQPNEIVDTFDMLPPVRDVGFPIREDVARGSKVAAGYHKMYVQKALREGKPVPEHVRKEYGL